MDEPLNEPIQPASFFETRPDLNYCAVCGASLEDRHAFGRERRYCPHCQRTVFYEHKVAAAVLITQNDGSVLLVQRARPPYQGRWSLPAGFVDVDEAPAAAAARECLEETGLNVEITHLIEVIGGQRQTGGADIVIVYRGVRTGGNLAAGDDACDARFFPLNQLPTLAFTSTVRTLAQWRRQRNGESV
jgi:ADP-ribose pyrophosphatase YjhB (NUDIX family)